MHGDRGGGGEEGYARKMERPEERKGTKRKKKCECGTRSPDGGKTRGRRGTRERIRAQRDVRTKEERQSGITRRGVSRLSHDGRRESGRSKEGCAQGAKE